MRTASILLALVVLGCCREAGAIGLLPQNVYTIRVGGYQFGFSDTLDESSVVARTVLYAGPFGYREVPFTATQGLVGFCMLVVGILALVTVATFRWRRKRAG